MILEEKVKDLVVIGEDTSKKAKISENKLAKLQYLLTKGLYKDPITAVIAEWTNNGIDSVVQAGKDPIETPVLVSIQKNEKQQYIFRVEDKGIGLDDRDFEDICMNYLESTKEDDNDTIGHFGIGMKSFLSLERSATFICRKAGVERKYLVYEGAEFVNFDLIYQKETDEENGVIAELVISNWDETGRFIEKAEAKLAYYDTAVLIVDGVPRENKIHRNDLFQWSSMTTTDLMHISLKDVYYEIDWNALGIRPIAVPVAIRLQLGDGLTPTPSRESYITNEKTRALLKDKIKEIAKWFVTRCNDTVRSFKNFMDVYEYLGQSLFYTKFEDKSFLINPLVPYSGMIVASPKVDGIKLRDPNEYKMYKDMLLTEYSPVAYVNSAGVVRGKRLQINKERHIFTDKRKTVLVGDDYRGNIKEFLKDKHGTDVLYVRRNGFIRELGKAKEYGVGGQLIVRTDTYRYILGLSTRPKKDWRPRIEEWNFVVSSIVSTFIDETKAGETKEFAEWLEDKREEQRLRRNSADPTEYQGLGKQVGDVTLAYGYERYMKGHFKKEAFPIRGLHKNRFLTVLVTEDDNLTLVKGIMLFLKDKDKVRFALVGKNEIKKVPKHFQFINFQQFMSRKCKRFMKLASAIKFQELITDYDKVKNYKNPVFKNALASFNQDIEELREYSNKIVQHPAYALTPEMKNILIDAADLHHLYDKSLWDRYLRVKEGLHKYDFIGMFAVPSTTNYQLSDRYAKIINQMLLFRKKYYNDLPEGAEIVFKAPVIKDTKTQTNEVV